MYRVFLKIRAILKGIESGEAISNFPGKGLVFPKGEERRVGPG
jgi:hypothetical protein